MGDKTGIEWTDATWNPVRGCSRVSEGCRHCYAETIAARFCDPGAPYHGFAERGRPGSKWTGRVDVIWDLIDQPLRWQKPRRIFVNSMSDLFHENLDIEALASIFAIMVAAVHLRGHLFQALTKRPRHMCHTLNQAAFWDQVNAEANMHVLAGTDPLNRRRGDARATLQDYDPANPPPGICLGISVENQAAFDERMPHLEATPAAIRFLSCEPLLSNIRFATFLGRRSAFTSRPGIDWVICGGESGPDARPMHPAWARSLRDQCAAANVPFFFKQWGEWRPVAPLYFDDDTFVEVIAITDEHRSDIIDPRGGRWGDEQCQPPSGSWVMERCGKQRAGAELDGVLHRAFPQVPA